MFTLVISPEGEDGQGRGIPGIGTGAFLMSHPIPSVRTCESPGQSGPVDIVFFFFNDSIYVKFWKMQSWRKKIDG